MTRPISRAQFLAAFGDDPGVLADGHIVGSTPSDWTTVVDVTSAADWAVRVQTYGGYIELPVSLSALNPGDTIGVRLNSRVCVNFFYWVGAVIFDIDLREFIEQGDVDSLLTLMRTLGTATGKEVRITHEGEDVPVLTWSEATRDFELNRPLDDRGSEKL